VVTFTSCTESTGGVLSWLCWCPLAYPNAAPSKKFSVAARWPPLMRDWNWLPRNIGSPFGFIGR
jgi:hypothetical protein